MCCKVTRVTSSSCSRGSLLTFEDSINRVPTRRLLTRHLCWIRCSSVGMLTHLRLRMPPNVFAERKQAFLLDQGQVLRIDPIDLAYTEGATFAHRNPPHTHPCRLERSRHHSLHQITRRKTSNALLPRSVAARKADSVHIRALMAAPALCVDGQDAQGRELDPC